MLLTKLYEKCKMKEAAVVQIDHKKWQACTTVQCLATETMLRERRKNEKQ